MATPGLPEPNTEALEYFRLRAAEYRERYENMRDLEWKMLLQTYGGYAAIVITFQKLLDLKPSNSALLELLPYGAMVATVAFCMAMHYIYYRIEERLIIFDKNYEYYARKQSELINHRDDAPGKKDLGHQFLWTYDTQMIIGTLAASALLFYEGFQRAPLAWNLAVTVVCLVGIGFWLLKRLRRLPNLVPPNEK